MNYELWLPPHAMLYQGVSSILTPWLYLTPCFGRLRGSLSATMLAKLEQRLQASHYTFETGVGKLPMSRLTD